MSQPRFLATALYFERRARQARLVSRRDRLLAVADKYRALAKQAVQSEGQQPMASDEMSHALAPEPVHQS